MVRIAAVLVALTILFSTAPAAYAQTAASVTVEADAQWIYVALKVPQLGVDESLKWNVRAHNEFHVRVAGVQVDAWLDLQRGSGRVVVKAHSVPGRPVLLDANVSVRRR